MDEGALIRPRESQSAEEDDTLDGANAIPSLPFETDNSVVHFSSSSDPDDWYQIVPTETGTHVFEISGPGVTNVANNPGTGALGATFFLFDANGNSFSNGSIGSPQPAGDVLRIVAPLEAGVTYYVKVSSTGNLQPGDDSGQTYPYTLTALGPQDPDADQYGDGFISATEIQISDGFVLAGEIQFPDFGAAFTTLDKDYVQFVAPIGGVWTISVTTSEPIGIGIADENFSGIGSRSEDGTTITVELTEGSRYIFFAGVSSTAQLPSYEVSFNYTPDAVVEEDDGLHDEEDLFGGTFDTATQIDLSDGLVLEGAIQESAGSAIDRDTVQFTAPSSGTWTITTTAGERLSTALRDENLNTVGGINDVGAFTAELTAGSLYYLTIEPWVGDEEPDYTVSFEFTPGAVIDDGSDDGDPDDEYGGGFADATLIQVSDGFELVGTIQEPTTTSTDKDYIQFTAPASGVWTITTTAAEQIFTGVWNDSLTSVGGRNDPGAFTVELTQGDLYYLALEPWLGDEAPEYTVTFELTSEAIDDGSGDNGSDPVMDGSNLFSEPTVLASPFFVSQSIGAGDAVDYFEITPTTDTTLEVFLNVQSTDLDLQLFNRDGIRIAASRNSGTTNESIVFDVSADETYIVGVTDNSGLAGSYILSGSFVLNDGSDDSPSIPDGSDTFTAPTTVSSPFTITQSVGGSDQVDYFSFTPTINATLELSMTGITGDIDLQLFDTNGTRLAASRNTGTEDENLIFEVTADQSYILAVTPNTGSGGSYVLNGSLVSSLNSDAGDTLETATVSTLPLSIEQTIGFSGDNQDLYQITPEADGELNIDLSGLQQNADLQLYDAEGRRLADPAMDGTNGEQITHDVSEGEDYFIAVVPRDGGTLYVLTADLTASQSGSAAAQRQSLTDGYSIAAEPSEVLALVVEVGILH